MGIVGEGGILGVGDLVSDSEQNVSHLAGWRGPLRVDELSLHDLAGNGIGPHLPDSWPNVPGGPANDFVDV